MDEVRVRIAPSPTGFAHVGTAYAALYNFAFARKCGGKFILRLEDTDVKRNVKGAEEAIYEGLSWLGFNWDEGPDKGGKYGPYRQSEKLEVYKSFAEDLVRKGLAYEDGGAIRFRNPGVDISWDDLIHGKIKFPGGEVTDFVILKSNGYPTYNFGVVIDDIQMKISHVIRGEEHISNTPRQLALYNALGVPPPKFAHFPTLRNKDHKKLSKRRDPVDLRIFRMNGFLPEALINFLCLLGWSHPEGKEIFGIDEFVRLFTLDRVRRSGPIFDLDKLEWINGVYIRSLKDKDLAHKIYEFFEGEYSQDLVKRILPLVKTRIKTLKDFEALAGFFFKQISVDKRLLGRKYKQHLKEAFAAIESVDDWSNKKVSETLLGVIQKNGFNTGDFFMDLRIAITGSKVTPPINESIVILGKEKTLHRLRSALS